MGYYNGWRLSRKGRQELITLLGDAAGSVDVIVLEKKKTVKTPTLSVPSRDYSICSCGKPSRVLSETPASFMDYVCPGCEYCVTNCNCPGAFPRYTSPRIETLPDGVWWHCWNYGLFGDEFVLDSPQSYYLEGIGVVVQKDNINVLRDFVERNKVLGIAIDVQPRGKGHLVGKIQFPTAYSTHAYDNVTPHAELLQNHSLWDEITMLYQSLGALVAG